MCREPSLFPVLHLLSCVQLFATPWTIAHQVSLSITNSWSLLKFMSIELVMPSNHLILCCLLLLPPSIFHSIRVFSSESVLRIRWPKYWSTSFSISPSNEYSGLISFRMDWLDLLAVPRDSQESSPTSQFKSINSSELSFLHSPTLYKRLILNILIFSLVNITFLVTSAYNKIKRYRSLMMTQWPYKN